MKVEKIDRQRKDNQSSVAWDTTVYVYDFKLRKDGRLNKKTLNKIASQVPIPDITKCKDAGLEHME